MKVARPNTDQEAEVQVYINGEACKEFVLPAAGNAAPANIAQCFIAVNPGDQLAIKGTFTGTVWAGTFDLVADGSFLHESRVEGGADAEPKVVNKRKILFEKVLNCPYPPEWKSISPPTAMFEGTLHTEKLEDNFADQHSEWEIPIPDSDQPGIGSLCLTVNISQDSIAKYFKPDRWIDIDGLSDERQIIGGWRRQPVQSERELQPVKPQIVLDSGLTPDCQLVFRENPDGSDAGQKRSSKHRRHWQESRPGLKPWCKFCFYYRTKPVLEQAGCVLRSEEVQQLDPATDFKPGTNSKGRKKSRGEEEDDLTPPTKKRQTGHFTPTKHLGGTLELPKTKGTLGGTFRLPGKSPSKSPSAKDPRRSKSRGMNDTAFLRELADYQADYERPQEEAEKEEQYRSGDDGDFDRNTDMANKQDQVESFKRPSMARTKRPAAVNSSYSIDRSGEPMMVAGIDYDGPHTSHLTRNGSIALGDHKRAYDSRSAGQPRASGEVSRQVRSADSSKAVSARSRTNSSHSNNITSTSSNTKRRQPSNMPAYDRIPTVTEIRNCISSQGCHADKLIWFFNQNGPYPNAKKVQTHFQNIINEIAVTNEETGMVTLRSGSNMRPRRDSSRVATDPPTTNNTPINRKQVSASAELFAESVQRAETRTDLTEPFNYSAPVADDQSHYETTLPASDTPNIKQDCTTELPANTTSVASDRSKKRGMLEMADHNDGDTPTPSKKHTFVSNDDLEQARLRLEATKQRIDNERREMQVKKAERQAEIEQKKLLYEAEMARRAEKQRIKDEKQRIKDEKKRAKDEKKAREAEELRRQEEEKLRQEEEQRAAEEARLKEEAEQEKQRQLDAIEFQEEQTKILFEEEQLNLEREELDEAGKYDIPPEIESESEDDDDEAEESEEE